MANLRDDFIGLVRFETALWNDVERSVRSIPHTASLARHGILELADTDAGVRIQDIVDSLVITVGGASRLIDRMESDGLVERRSDPDDRRSSRIFLTTAGRTALIATSPAIDTALRDVLGPNAAAHLAAIAAVIERADAERAEARG
jgi:DNA-binding MarR family transcriptional regulator